MAAYAALLSLTNTINQITNHPRLSIYFVLNQIESLAEKVGFFLEFREADSHGVISKEAQALEGQLAFAAYAAEDAIESHIVDQIHAGSISLLDLQTVTQDMDINSAEIYWEEMSSPIQETLRLFLCSLKKVMKDIKRKVIKCNPIHSMCGNKEVVEDQIHTGSISLLDLQRVIQDIDSIKEEAMELIKGESGSNDLQPRYSLPTTSSTPLTTGKNSMVGFDEQLIQLMHRLTGQPSTQQIISVVGMGGIGKTTLAKHAYEHTFIVQHFDIRTWVTVSQKYNVREILLQLLSWQSKPPNETDVETEDQLGQRLHKKLWGRRYFIVVDDIWSIEAWDKVKLFFPDNDNGNRIVVTTRISDVAIHFRTPCLELSFLDEDKSWKLFCDKAFGQAGCPPQLEDIGKEIARRCKGLPLSIVCIGGLLGRSNKTQEYWKSIVNDLISILNSGEGEDDCLNILSLSYTHLSAHLKPCILYMGIFPEDHEISVSRLIKLWVAEGFIQSNKSQSLEDIARGYLNDLIDRNLILKHRSGSNGKIKLCKIHDLLRDLCLKVAHRDKFICMMKDIPRRVYRDRRLVFNERIPEEDYQYRIAEEEYQHRRLEEEYQYSPVLDEIMSEEEYQYSPVLNETFQEEEYQYTITEEEYEYSTESDGRNQAEEHSPLIFPSSDPNSFEVRTLVIYTNWSPLSISNKLLRVFDLLDESVVANIYKTNGTSDEDYLLHLSEQVNLRYLAYRCKFRRLDVSDEFVLSASLLWNMQTLIIGGSIHAPPEIWEMRQLRHVDINLLHLPQPPPSGRRGNSVLRSLQTLKTVINFTWSDEACKRAFNVKKLNIKYDDYPETTSDYCLPNVGRLRKLESLTCSYARWNNKDDLVHNLSLPSSLKKLCVTNCKIHWENLRMIGSLPHLEVLKLGWGSAVGPVWDTVEGDFLRLKFLLVQYSDLVCWNSGSSHFPVLEKLVLQRLGKLEEIPLEIGEIPTLGDIHVDCCSESAAISAMRIAQEQENDGNEGLQVRVEFDYEAQVESFREKVNLESFTSNNFRVKGNIPSLQQNQ